MIFYNLIVIAFGLVFGSFINVCIYRIPREESINFPGSHCTSCKAPLKAVDLIPVFSYIFLRGKCRYCGAKISPRYVLIEALAAGIFCLLFWKYRFSVYFIASCFLMIILISVFFIDLEHKIIPNGLVLSAIIGGIPLMIYNVFKPIGIYSDRNWYNPLIGFFASSGILFVIALLGLLIYKSDGAMGMGDVKIFAPIGIFLGWRMVLVALFVSVIFAGLTGIVLIIFKLKDRKAEIPFGPFIVTGTFVTLMYGQNILGWYLNRL